MSQPELKEFRIKGFKSFEDAVFPLSPLTLLIGANASGKSNLVEALQLFQWLAMGGNLPTLPFVMKEGVLPIRGLPEGFGYREAKEFWLGCGFTLGNEEIRLDVSLRLLADGWHVGGESLAESKQGGRVFYEASPDVIDDYALLIEFPSDETQEVRVGTMFSDRQAVFTQLTPVVGLGALTGREEDLHVLGEILSLVRFRLSFLSPNPARMRDYASISDVSLDHDGSNVSSVLRSICATEQAKREIVEFVKEVPEEPLCDLRFLTGPRGEVLLEVQESFGELRWRDASILSDGTLRVLAIAAAVFGAAPGSTLVIEEIENGLHPSRLAGLLHRLQQVASHRGLQIVFTSHNATLMNVLPNSALSGVVCCYRDESSGASRLVKLADLPNYPELIGQGPLGRLLESGLVDRYIHDIRSDQERLQANLTWLEQFKRQVEPS